MEVWYRVSVEKEITCDNVDEMYNIVKELENYTDGWNCSIKSIEQDHDADGNVIGTYTIILKSSIGTENKEDLSELCRLCTNNLP